ncbi:acyl-CoA dehydrogenase family protein [Streptomyces orinoci]|uniref:Acyl-CoA dehydrogenase family protein n=1 Tax=Streptomyces orinoci TaxID=67339 RepID=A0ABV3K3Z3_STRON|nr:acyl-CoA dehydrogenase family protein [Streptomyces orinoci]
MAPAFALDPRQRRWTRELRQLAVERLRPLTGSAPPGRVNRPLVGALGELGLLARVFPAGGRAAAMDLCLLRESLAQECTEAETALALQGLGAHPLVLAGTPAQRAHWLARVTEGRAVIAFALSEAGAGSDAAALALRAEPAGEGWVLRGGKTWISNAPDADVYTVFARTGPAAGARGITAFLVPADRPGLSGRPLAMLAPHPIGALSFDGVPVGPEDVIGEVGGGFALAMRTLELFRPSVGAFAVGMARAALRAAVAHAGQRRAFGGTLADLQAVSHQLAEMATRTEAAALLVYAAAEAYDAGERGGAGSPAGARSAMAKLFATETAQFVVDAAVQIHGACALERGHPLEHLYREVRATRIYEGATEVQRTVIARELYR